LSESSSRTTPDRPADGGKPGYTVACGTACRWRRVPRGDERLLNGHYLRPDRYPGSVSRSNAAGV